MIKTIEKRFQESIATKQYAAKVLPEVMVKATQKILNALHQGNKILTCGNGGSAGDAQHFASELLNRFEHNRAPLPAIALTPDALTTTAIANDFGYDHIFSKQIEALAQPNDVLLAISTSGQSRNILEAVKKAHERKICIIALTGKDGGALAALLSDNDIEIRVPSMVTARIQETHLLVIHCLCELIENAFLKTTERQQCKNVD